MKKKWMSLILGLVFSVSLTVPAAAAGGFEDVDANAYYAPAVDWAVDNGIASGTTDWTFSPDQTCTRAQIVMFLWRAAGSPEFPDAVGVGDVAESDYFYKAVLWAKEAGLFEADAFRPHDPCTRMMAVDFLWRTFGAPEVFGDGFSDAVGFAVNWAVKQGVTAGTAPNTFSPDQTCTRGQIVTFLYKAFSGLEELPGKGNEDRSQWWGTYVPADGGTEANRLIVTEEADAVGFALCRGGTGTMSGTLSFGAASAYLEPFVRLNFYDGYLTLELENGVNAAPAGKYVKKTGETASIRETLPAAAWLGEYRCTQNGYQICIDAVSDTQVIYSAADGFGDYAASGVLERSGSTASGGGVQMTFSDGGLIVKVTGVDTLLSEEGAGQYARQATP